MKREGVSPTEEIFDVFMAKNQMGELATDHNHLHNAKPNESDKDSDYGGSDCGCGETTTLRMLLERSSGSGDVEFAECCYEAGLVPAPTKMCQSCSRHASPDTWRIVPDESAIDAAAWQCSACHALAPLRPPGTWLTDLQQVRLKEAVLVIYCWTRNYPVELCSHETELRPDIVTLIYDSCRSITIDYFNNEISNLRGGVEVTLVRVENGGCTLVGGMEDASGSVFLRKLADDWNRDDIVSALVDNLASSSAVLRVSHAEMEKSVGDGGFHYLKEVWAIAAATSSPPSPILEEALLSLWNRYKKQNGHYSEDSLREFLFRRRMDSSRDPFLFFLAVVSSLYPLTTV